MNNTLNETERGALLSLCVMAAYADGEKDDREGAEVNRIGEGLDAPRFNPVLIYKEALTQRRPIADTAARLESPAAKAMAYEMAVCICDADEVLDEREKKFLEELRAALGLKWKPAAEFQKQAEAITTLPMPLVQGTTDESFEVPVRQAEGQPAAAGSTRVKGIVEQETRNSMNNTKNILSANSRKKCAALLNQTLADLFDLYSQTKQAHWNVRGPMFYPRHKLFDDLAGMVGPHLDTVAERATALGGVAAGTVRQAAAQSALPEFPQGKAGDIDDVAALVDRYAQCANSVRQAIDEAATTGDAATADLFTEILRDLDQALWFLEAHTR